jgi:hypothetical protein
MVQATIRRFGAIRALVLVGLLGIALIASTAVPAVGSSNTWSPTGSMTNARTHRTATLLANGEVLVAGGGNTTILPGAELYKQTTGKWTAAGSMITARTAHTARLLANGEVAGRGRAQQWRFPNRHFLHQHGRTLQPVHGPVDSYGQHDHNSRQPHRYVAPQR